MPGVCPTCRSLAARCICEDVTTEGRTVAVRIAERRSGKEITVLTGFDPNAVDMEKLVLDLQSQFACDGILEAGSITLYGNHTGRVEAFLRKRGFSVT